MNGIKNLKPARRYSKALFELTKELGGFEDVYKDLGFIQETICKNPELANFLNNPIISKADKNEVLREIFTGKTQAKLLDFLSLLNEENRLDLLGEIILAYKEENNRVNNILKAGVTSAIELNETQKKQIVSKLEHKFEGKTIKPEFMLNKEILGGLIVKINDTVIDLSLKNKLKNLKNMIER